MYVIEMNKIYDIINPGLENYIIMRLSGQNN